MLVHALTQHFQSYFGSADSNTTILWFDPDHEYEALLPHLTGVTLWRYDGSLLRLRYRLIQRPAGEKTVVYLPMRSEDAEVLRPFFATSLLFTDRLYKFLRRQGLGFPDDPQVAYELRSLLPRLAARSVGKGHDFWTYNLANLERARETLIGSFDDALLRFLAQPSLALGRLKQEQLDGLFFAQLETSFGLVAAAENDPDEVARRLAAQLILTCVYAQAEINLAEHGLAMPDFPFANRLAAPMYRDRCWHFVTRWQYDRQHSTSYIRLANQLQGRYDLTRWVVDLPQDLGLTLRASFANVQDALWSHIDQALSGLESEKEWRDWLSSHDGPIGARANDFWAREGRDPGWRLLVLARDLLMVIDGLSRELDRYGRPTDLIRGYAERWYKLDQDYRRLHEAIDSTPNVHDRLRQRCAVSYHQALAAMNERLCTLLIAEKTWPAGALPAQDTFWSDAPGKARAGRKIAVFLVDALRYELGQELFDMLGADQAGQRRRIMARLAVTPTVTPIGMAALLPDGQSRHVDYQDDWQVTIGDSGNLKDKVQRQKLLKARLKDVAFYNLDELLKLPSDRLTLSPVTVVFETSLDAVGETASQQAWNTFSTLLQSVKKGVHKLLAVGIHEVHVIADHGFLLLDEVGEHEKASVKTVPALAIHERYLLGRSLGKTDQVAFSVPSSEDLIAWYPLGIGCFKTPGPYNYVHGGLSLQELVIPHLTITQQAVGRPVGVRAELPARITGQFKVLLEPVVTSTIDQPRQVTLTLEAAGQPVAPPLSCVVEPGGATEQTILLPQGCGLEGGQRVRWVLRDAVTGEVLAEQDAVSQVDLW